MAIVLFTWERVDTRSRNPIESSSLSNFGTAMYSGLYDAYVVSPNVVD